MGKLTGTGCASERAPMSLGAGAQGRAGRRIEDAEPVTISAAAREDIPALAALRRQVCERTYRPAHPGPELDAWLDQHTGPGHYEYRVGRAMYTVLVARDRSGSPAGVATMRQRGQRADISGLYVLHSGRGIGSALIAELQRIAREAGCTRERSSVWRTNEGGTAFVLSRGLAKAGGYREGTVGVMVDHYEGDL